MIVNYSTSIKIGEFKRLDQYWKQNVLGLAFKHGGMYYFKKDRFNYLTLPEDCIVSTEEDGETTVYTKHDYLLKQKFIPR